ncbi:Tm-1-like ATP-binding domain-containing protein [Paenibacillus endoradicis]|uniref:Tm-1-like ATP-binding domain-containing protein n=1 Tax=Paenibacillus endoradicis TaxID=2972487 RepID=UPI0021599A43|nr:Tm-1-like ATP-binding domain-containing protein [Paenibacillus endoradicis]MCR8656552.1 Tm-1-like ATP-binding domain-containing protein [Paenibacillus endoradicis]
MATICLIGAMDTKGKEFQFLKDQILMQSHQVIVIDTGVIGNSQIEVDINRHEVMDAVNGSIEELIAFSDRGKSIGKMAEGTKLIVRKLIEERTIQGIIGMGGTAGTTLASTVMLALPIGFPKLIISTVASGDTSSYVGTKDIIMIPSIVDISGINRISKQILSKAAGAMCGMVEMKDFESLEEKNGVVKPIIAASMFGNTTTCVENARNLLEQQGNEVLVFHCTGIGGKTIESLVEGNYIDAILDITTTEWADEIVGGIFAAGNTRGDSAAELGIPQVIVPGCVDMVNFGNIATVPKKYASRQLYEWNTNTTLMRTTPAENRLIGEKLADKANSSHGPVAFIIPKQGFSILDSPGQLFWDPEADEACIQAIKENIKPHIQYIELDCNINDPQVSEYAVSILVSMMTKGEN